MGVASEELSGEYIWCTVRDEKVRSSHAVLEGEIRNFDEGLCPGDDYNCRCWAISVKDEVYGPPDCRRKLRNVENLEDEILNIQKRLDNIMSRTLDLKKEKDEVFHEISKVLGVFFASNIITIPIRFLDNLSEAIRRLFGMQIQGEMQDYPNYLGLRLKGVRLKLENLLAQKQVSEYELMRAMQELEEAKDGLRGCVSGKGAKARNL